MPAKRVVEVWHAKTPNFGIGDPPQWPDEYVKVAEVDGTCPELAYARTQHTERPWWENEEVTLLSGTPNPRSTAVGDVVVIGGECYRCENFGWVGIHKGA